MCARVYTAMTSSEIASDARETLQEIDASLRAFPRAFIVTELQGLSYMAALYSSSSRLDANVNDRAFGSIDNRSKRIRHPRVYSVSGEIASRKDKSSSI